MQDSPEYKERKKFFDKILTLYGRKPCLEALEDFTLQIHRLHLSDSNRPAPILKDIIAIANKRDIPVSYHGKRELSRISKNSQQDQGVALDCVMPQFYSDADIEDLANKNARTKIIALDAVTNPQNVGMIIRNIAASGITGLLLPKSGCARLDALVIKASTGTIFKAPIILCSDLANTLAAMQTIGFNVATLTGEASQTLQEFSETDRQVYVLGNESRGVSDAVKDLCDEQLRIPMRNQVESLNVAVVSGLLAFRHLL